MGQPEDLFNEAFLRATEQFGTIGAFRDVFDRGLPMAKEVTVREHKALLYQLVTDPRHAGILNREAVMAAGASWAADMVGRMTETAMRSAQNSASAASLVFAHSVLDAWLFDLCRVTAMMAPRDWEASVQDRKVPLLSIRDATYEQLLEEALARFFERLERDSLLKKIDLLFQRCRPERDWLGENYKYDEERVTKLDTLRHEIIHGDALQREIPDLGRDLFYLEQTGMNLMGIVSLRYGVKLDPSYAERKYSGGRRG